MSVKKTTAALLLVCTLAHQALGTHDVHSYGAKGDGQTLDTASIQRAIDHCADRGGGEVIFPAGSYRTGTLFLKSRVILHLRAGAELTGSTDLADYPATRSGHRSYTDNYTERSLIYAERVERIGITGAGTINGNGAHFEGPYKRRPYTIRMIECRDIAVTDITLIDSPMWVQHYLACDRVRIEGITVRSRVNHNNDGIDIDGCRRVRITGCDIDSGDDAIVLKSTSDRRCENVVITNCILSSACNAIKCGTESNGGFANIAISNCTIYDTRLAGIALEVVDGGCMENVVVSNITMQDAKGGLFVRLGNRARPFLSEGPGGSVGNFKALPGAQTPGIGRMRGIVIRDVLATGVSRTGNSITGLAEQAVEDVTLDTVRLVMDGGGSAAESARPIPEKERAYPEFSMFGTLPAYGLFCRHVKGLTLRNVSLQFGQDDNRPALFLDDVTDVRLDGLAAAASPRAPALIWMNDVRHAWVQGCSLEKAHPYLLALRGPRSRAVFLHGNRLARAERIVDLGAAVPEGTVRRE
jgi:polygalacturonase